MEPQASPSGWEAFNRSLMDRVGTTAWRTWIEPLRRDIAGDVLRIEAPTDFHRRWVQDKLLPAIREVGAETFGPDLTIVLEYTAPADDADDPEPEGFHPVQPAAPTTGPAPARRSTSDSRLIPKYSFDNFVVGQSNRFAHAAAMAVAEQPGSHYNPLFIYGGAGLGKTHLLHAVGHHCRELSPGTVVRYVTSEQFFNEFINGIRRKRMDEFKERYRTIDVLLLDDVQFFERKEQILEEFFHTFNSLYEAGRQLVISSDRHPKNLSTLEDRLRSRFEWGLLTDIQPPDVETRLAILRKNAEFAPTPVPRDVLEFIATHVLDNIRELEGALTRVTAFAALTRERITLDVARGVLQDLVPQPDARPITAGEIITITAGHTGIPTSDLTGPSRKQPLARTRQVAMYLCRELTDLSLPKIGEQFGGRDHTTVLHAIDRVKSLIQSDKEVFDQVSELTQKLRRS